jgi:predicted nucleic acid-binding Zn ribbon protein
MALGMNEPSHVCEHCEAEMKVEPAFPAGFKLIGAGFHCNDYPPPLEKKMENYGLSKYDSTNPESEYYDG